MAFSIMENIFEPSALFILPVKLICCIAFVLLLHLVLFVYLNLLQLSYSIFELGII